MILYLSPYLLFFFFIRQQTGSANGEIKRRSRYFYDQIGVLHIDGSFPGMTEPIAIDKSLYRKNNCFPRNYFVFSFCANKQMIREKKELKCEEGMTFCYDGQLVKGVAQSHFTMNKEDNEVSKKCEKFNGFSVRLLHLPQNLVFLYPEYHNGTFFEINASFMKEPHFYAAPADLCIDLWLGNPDGIITYVTDRRNQPLMPIQVLLPESHGTLVGRNYKQVSYSPGLMLPRDQLKLELKDLPPFPDLANLKPLEEHKDLQMLYMDFKARDFAAQYIIVIGGSENSTCALEAIVRGSVVGTCKTLWRQRQLTLRAYGDPNSTTYYSFTMETGIEQSQKKQQKNSQTTANTEGGETDSSESTEDFEKTSLQNEEENSKEVSDSHGTTKTSGDSMEVGAHTGVNAGIKKGKFGVDAERKIGLNAKFDNSVTEGFNEMKMRGTSNSKSETSGASTSTLLENSLRHTWENTQSSTQMSFSSHTVTTTETTKFKWRVKVPAGMYLTPMQMKMDCQGRRVKIPWIRFVLWKEENERPVEDYSEEEEVVDQP